MDRRGPVRLFLAGDVMTGRGIDQILPRSVDPVLHEPYVTDAGRYVRLAEEVSGPIPDDVPPPYVWGDALGELDRVAPDLRIVNLETSITTSDEWWRAKAIHYRMHPANVDVLRAAKLDACVLGNNHVLDWGRPGLMETLRVLEDAGLATPGAGRDAAEASAPARFQTGGRRVLVFSYGSPSAGVYPDWAASGEGSGVNLLSSLGRDGADGVVDDVRRHRREGDLVVVSVHWGGNWGHDVPDEQRAFAHRLIDAGAADVIHGHSSHHPKALEIHRGRLVLYGAGDFLNDYEGIGGRESFRSDLTLMYFPELSPSGALAGLTMTPLRIRRFRLESVGRAEARWLASTLDRESRQLDTRVDPTPGGRLTARALRGGTAAAVSDVCLHRTPSTGEAAMQRKTFRHLDRTWEATLPDAGGDHRAVLFRDAASDDPKTYEARIHRDELADPEADEASALRRGLESALVLDVLEGHEAGLTAEELARMTGMPAEAAEDRLEVLERVQPVLETSGPTRYRTVETRPE